MSTQMAGAKTHGSGMTSADESAEGSVSPEGHGSTGQAAGSPLIPVAWVDIAIETKIVLRRTGKKSLRFDGERLAEATGYGRHAAHWFEINVFERAVGGYVADIRHFYKSDEHKDHFVAERFETLDELASFLEGYQPDEQLRVDFNPSSQALSPAEVALRAAGLRGRQADYRLAYQTVVGDLLHQLDLDAA